jgi:iron complex transport system substrate-binding protein
MVGKSVGLVAFLVSILIALQIIFGVFFAPCKVLATVLPVKTLVSLAPSNTELLYAIGAGSKLAGVSTFCDYPPEAIKQEKVGTFVSANLERIARIKPDTVLLVSGQEALSSMLSHNGFHTRVLQNTKLSDIAKNIRELGAITGQTKESQAIAANFDASMNSLLTVLAKASSHPKIFYCVWPQPLLTVGHSSFLSDVITTCGGINIAASASAAYPQFSAEKLLLSDPDIIILPYEAKGKISLDRSFWSSLRAVKKNHAYYLPEPEKNGLIRPTLRVINGLSWLSERLHPELKPALASWHNQSFKLLNLASP